MRIVRSASSVCWSRQHDEHIKSLLRKRLFIFCMYAASLLSAQRTRCRYADGNLLCHCCGCELTRLFSVPGKVVSSVMTTYFTAVGHVSHKLATPQSVVYYWNGLEIAQCAARMQSLLLLFVVASRTVPIACRIQYLSVLNQHINDAVNSRGHKG